MERMALRTQTVVADVAFAAIAFLIAFQISPPGAPSLAAAGVSTLSLPQLVVLYAVLAPCFFVGSCPLGDMRPYRMRWCSRGSRSSPSASS